MLKGALEKVDRSFSWVENWSLLLMVCIALVVAIANVLLRKLTADVNLFWSDEVVRKTIYVSTYIGCVVAVRNRSQIVIDALPQMVPGLQKPLALFSHLMVLLFAGCMTYLGGTMTYMMYLDTNARTSSLNLPEWIFYAVLPLMGVMMFLRTLILLFDQGKEGGKA